MPPQRRKIVPPTTTSKARKKVAGSGRKPLDSSTAPTPESDASFEKEPLLQTGTVEQANSAQASGTDTAAKPAPAKPVFDKKPSVDETASAQKSNSPDVEPNHPVQQDKPRVRLLAVAVVGVLAAILVAFATAAAFKPGTQLDNAAWVDQGVTSEVTRAATDGITALYRYNYETIDDDLDNAATFMSPTMKEDTAAFLESIKSNARQTQTATDVDVMDIGITRLEQDKAEILANVNVSSTRAGAAYGNAMFPLVVNMEKIDGKWVVSATQNK